MKGREFELRHRRALKAKAKGVSCLLSSGRGKTDRQPDRQLIKATNENLVGKSAGLIKPFSKEVFRRTFHLEMQSLKRTKFC